MGSVVAYVLVHNGMLMTLEMSIYFYDEQTAYGSIGYAFSGA